jgi:hypothetical protein
VAKKTIYFCISVAFVRSCAPAHEQLPKHANNSENTPSNTNANLHDLSQTYNLFPGCFYSGHANKSPRAAFGLVDSLHLCCFKGFYPQRRQNGLLSAVCGAGQSQGTVCGTGQSQAPRFLRVALLQLVLGAWCNLRRMRWALNRAADAQTSNRLRALLNQFVTCA